MSCLWHTRDLIRKECACVGHGPFFFFFLVHVPRGRTVCSGAGAFAVEKALLLVPPFCLSNAILVCKSWRTGLLPDKPFWRLLLQRWKLPVPDDRTPYEAFQGYWFVLRCMTFPKRPSFANRESLYRSAQMRINFGCVLELSEEYERDIEPPRPYLLMRIKSVMTSVVHVG